ncbi:hypothetical protein [Deinococcus terrestris]|uniref:hypothetical protein n=1 Tax=Deinococcus terrestris TaxID=2651870 RepID=UPI001883D981|nr:hypothetical protein [Deinococcus terrestris]
MAEGDRALCAPSPNSYYHYEREGAIHRARTLTAPVGSELLADLARLRGRWGTSAGC